MTLLGKSERVLISEIGILGISPERACIGKCIYSVALRAYAMRFSMDG